LKTSTRAERMRLVEIQETVNVLEVPRAGLAFRSFPAGRFDKLLL
jgi:hypothetical protein